ncbi:hypothetical protein C8J57DRAFT_1252650 [Mycena rebaudengoi]|nr:hypothetical protein C8J57DRAFT_1252650 [Mycena rebaudengoi]
MLTKVFYTLAASAFAALVAHIYDSEPSFSPRNLTATAVVGKKRAFAGLRWTKSWALAPSLVESTQSGVVGALTCPHLGALTQTGQAEDPSVNAAEPGNAERAWRDWRREDGNGAQRFNDKRKKMGAREEPRTVTELWVIIECLRVRGVCTQRGGGMLLVKRRSRGAQLEWRG